MSKRQFTRFSAIRSRDFFAVFVLLFNSFTWLFMTRRIIDVILQDFGATHSQNLVIWGVYDLAIIGSGLIGAILSNKISRSKFIYIWMLFGTITSSLLLFFSDISLLHVLGVSFLWGFSFGLGIPSALAYFADYTSFENRGLIGGIIFLITNVSAPLVVVLSKMDLTTNFLIFTVWRGLGLMILILLKPSEKTVPERRKHVSFASILNKKSFYLYLIPWLMFGFIDWFEKPILERFLGPDTFDFLRMIEAIIGTVFALIGGLIADLIGRKRVVIYGFISLGLAYAVIGIVPTMLISRYFYTFIDGIAWGIFFVIFVLILWGDLSSADEGAREKYYFIGSIPFFLADIVGLLFVPFISFPPTAAFSVASLFLFLAVLPLMYAPETLPEKKIRLRKLRKYMETAKKVKEKYTEKGS